MSWDDLEEDAAGETRPPGKACGMRLYLASLPEEGREAIRRALLRPELQVTAIRAALVKRSGRGLQVPSAWTIRQHRRGDCGCAAEE